MRRGLPHTEQFVEALLGGIMQRAATPAETGTLSAFRKCAMKLLMATDGSPSASTAIQTATRLLRPQDYEIDLLCVAPPFQRGAHYPGGRLREAYERHILTETTNIVDQAQRCLRLNGFEAHPLSEIGPPAETILQKMVDYDLTVIGARGRNMRVDVGLGPVASRVVEHSVRPILIGRELVSDRGFRALVPVDGSIASLHALDAASGLFNFEIAEITLMHVIETPWIHLGLEDEWIDEYEVEEAENQPDTGFEGELTREADAVIEQARAYLSPTDAAVQTLIERGNPGNEILAAAERGQHDLIILGATGVTDLKHRLLGSVSTKIAWNASCSVLVVSTVE